MHTTRVGCMLVLEERTLVTASSPDNKMSGMLLQICLKRLSVLGVGEFGHLSVWHKGLMVGARGMGRRC